MAGALLYISRFLLAGAFVVAGLFLLSFVLSSTEPENAQAKGKTPARTSNSPNVVTNGMADTADGLARTMDSAGHALNSGIKSATSTVAQAGKTIASGAQTGTATAASGIGNGLAFSAQTNGKTIGLVGRTMGTGISFVANTVGAGVSFVANIPGNIIGSVSNSAAVNSVIRPADHDEVPIIDPDSAELQTAIAALPPAEKPKRTAPQNKPGPQWPMHGRVTTEFGVDHWPFQHTHTGIDISNGHGVAIKPFRPGKVIEVVHSSSGLGNHVIVDHGNGVTSVYAHLASIAVRGGQKVGLSTELGREGTTGVSTGNHLHFEIRVNGQAANPRQFINGQP